MAAWLVPFLVRADLLAMRLQRRFRNLSTAMFAMAAAAVAIVADSDQLLSWSGLACRLGGLAVAGAAGSPAAQEPAPVARALDVSYRFLAERLRSAYFLALAGTGDPGQQPNQSASFSDPSVAWIERALSEITTSRPRVKLVSSDLVPLRSYLNGCWIGSQVKYHTEASTYNETWENRLRRATAVLFGITLVSAFLHAVGLGPRLHLAADLVVLSISIPAIGEAVHGIETQREYRRHAQRCKRMVTQLEQLQYQMNEAQSLPQIRRIAANVERSMREESNDWFGVMRFHDIELIT